MSRVLIVDDYALARETMREILSDDPTFFIVGEAPDGEPAVHLAAELLPDIILMDIELPGISGIEATRQIVAAHPDMHVVAVSMHAERHFVVGAKEAGAVGYVLKDTLATELHDAVRAVIGGGSSFIIHDNSA